MFCEPFRLIFGKCQNLNFDNFLWPLGSFLIIFELLELLRPPGCGQISILRLIKKSRFWSYFLPCLTILVYALRRLLGKIWSPYCACAFLFNWTVIKKLFWRKRIVKYTQTFQNRPLLPYRCHFSENLRLALLRPRITLSSMHIRATYALRVIFEILGHRRDSGVLQRWLEHFEK